MSSFLRFGNFELDIRKETLSLEGEMLVLRPKSMAVLIYLIQNAGQLVLKRTLMEAVWGPAEVSDAALNQCIMEIRRVLGDNQRTLIRTLPRRGFVFDANIDTALKTDAKKSNIEYEREFDSVSNRKLQQFAIPFMLSLCALLIVVGLGRWTSESGLTDDAQGVLVLPFEIIPLEAGRADLGISISNEIRLVLTKHTEMRVFGFDRSNSPRTFDASEAVEEQSLDILVDGIVQTVEDGYRVSVFLKDAMTGEETWAESWLVTDEGITESQHTIALQVASELRALELGAEQDRDTLTAWELYHRGHFLYDRRGAGDLISAQSLFEEAIELSPHNERYLTALIATRNILIQHEELAAFTEHPSFPSTRDLVNRALGSEAVSTETLIRASDHFRLSGDYDQAHKLWLEALSRGTQDALIASRLTSMSLLSQDKEEVLQFSQIAADSELLTPTSLANHAVMLLNIGLLDEAQQTLRKVELLGDAGRNVASVVKAEIALVNGDYEEALELSYQMPESPHRGRIRELAETGIGGSASFEVYGLPAFEVLHAEQLAILGRTDEAIAMIDQLIETSTWQYATLVEIASSPILAGIRAEPALIELMRTPCSPATYLGPSCRPVTFLEN
ncbi:MAG: winged helix-turn-helix domain-containing protein [Pseudomonadota bacterium]